MFKSSLFVSALLFALCQVPALAAPPVPDSKPQVPEQQEPHAKPAGGARPAFSTHQARIGGKEISYQALAGTLPVQNDAGETEAEIFYVSYRVQQPATAKSRPLLFVFNGGPGAASVWLHLGALGPRRVQMLPDGNMPAPPFHLVDNASSWLDVADLVFVDPVGTGYSRAVKPDLTKKFAAVQGDIDSLGRFIRLYLTRNARWDAPVFLVGESYGTFRSAGLAEYLAEHGVALNGLILVSSILNMQTVSFDYGNDLPYQLFLPSYTATAWYHRKLAPELQADLNQTLAQAEQWAATEYLWALNKGDRLTAAERKAVAEKLAGFTGLRADLVLNRNLRVDNRDFAKELLRGEGRMVGLMDSRFNAENPEPGRHLGFDATVATIRPPFTSAVNAYLREELGYQSDLEYFVLGGGIGRWDWEAKNGYADTGENLRNAMVKNPYLKVLIASGLFDLATPHFATDYTVAHLGLGEELQRNISVKRYRSGHMMYLASDSLAELKKDAADFISATLKR
ncbi:S10 family peptidase [Geomonas azotofigens]|uniref:S10 family peptidase n=1 Tax=Geomonas azotofigens TaxID=2843196 RepID=UPI001C10C493|nr:peptidase S10 [Geomonas azotofigens]MBU5614016.1 peptidase S10 [Geomonas azotofigens]